MGYNKFITKDDVVLLDLTSDTVTAESMMSGTTAHDKSGTEVTGTFSIDSELSTQDDLIAQIQTALEGKAANTGTDTSDTTATASDILSGKTAYVDGEKITGTIATKTSSNLTSSGATVTVPAGYYASNASKSVSTATQATPSITVSSAGKITASATQTAGYVSAGTKSGTKQLTTQAAKTVTPSTSSQTAVASGVYTTGAVTVAGDSNLIAANIAEGVSIFGVAGTHSGGGSAGGSVETCTVTVSYGASATDTSYTVSNFVYTAYEDETISTKISEVSTSGAVVLSNVVKGSAITYPSILQSYTNATFLDYASSIGNIYVINGDATLHGWTCFVYGTKILLSNNETKEVQDITYEDELLVWDFDNGCYSSAKPLWIKQEETALFYYHCVFENGIELDLVGSNGNCHAIFNLDENKFEYANKCVGKTIMTSQGATKLLSCELKQETVKFYNIITNYHMNCYANNVLTSTKLNNIYSIEDMKFIKDNRETILYEAYPDIPIEFYKGLRLGENKFEDVEWIIENVKNKLSKTLPKEV